MKKVFISTTSFADYSKEPLDILENNNIDLGMAGEGEFSMRELINALINNNDISKIPGLVKKIADKKYRIICYSPTSKVFSGSEGEILYIPTQISSDITPRTVSFSLSNILISDVNMTNVLSPTFNDGYLTNAYIPQNDLTANTFLSGHQSCCRISDPGCLDVFLIHP